MELVTSSQVAAAVRIEMISRGISRSELAGLTGLKPGTITNLISGCNPNNRGRFAIEDALSMPLWHSVDELDRWRQARLEKEANRSLQFIRAKPSSHLARAGRRRRARRAPARNFVQKPSTKSSLKIQ